MSSEHTHSEHAGAVGSHCCGARGAIGGSVPCSRAPQSWYWRWRECCSFTIPTFNPCRTWDSNPQPLDYKSDSLTIFLTCPRMLHLRNTFLFLLHLCSWNTTFCWDQYNFDFFFLDQRYPNRTKNWTTPQTDNLIQIKTKILWSNLFFLFLNNPFSRFDQIWSDYFWTTDQTGSCHFKGVSAFQVVSKG